MTDALGELELECNEDLTIEKAATILGRNSFTADDRQLQELLKQPIFRRNDGLTTIERCQQTYEALKLLIRSYPLSRQDVLECSDRLLRLHEWSGVVNGTLVTLLTIHYNLCLGCILQHKAEQQNIDDVIDKLLSGEVIGVFLATELGYGNNVMQLKTEACYDENSETFNIVTTVPESKKFMPNMGLDGVPKIGCVLAKLMIRGKNQGVFPFIVPLRDDNGALMPGINVTPLGEKPGYDLDNAITWFDNITIPARFALLGKNAHIDENGDFHCTERNLGRRFLNTIDRVQMGKLCLSASIAQGLKPVIKIAFNYSEQRRTFALGRHDVSIFSYNSHKQSLIQCLVQVLAIDAFYQDVAALRNSDISRMEFNFYLAALKSYASSEALRFLNEMRERIGAQGMFSQNGIIDNITAVHAIITAEGDNHVIKSKIAGDLISNKELALPEGSQYTSNSLLDADFQSYALRSRAQKLLCDVKTHLTKDRVPGEKMFTRWNQKIVPSIQMIDAHAIALVHRSLRHQREVVGSEFRQEVYGLTCSLFFVMELEKHQGSYLLLDIINKEQATSLYEHKMALCDALYDLRHDIVENLNIPDELIASPLIGDYIDYFDKFSTPTAWSPRLCPQQHQ